MQAEATAQQNPAPVRRLRLPRFFTPIAIVGVIIVIECVAAAVLLPSAKDTETLAKELAHARVNGSDAAAEAEAEELGPPQDLREVSLGSYHIAVFQPESNTTLRIDVDLYGILLAEEQSEFEESYLQHEHRLSEQVHAAFRSAEIGDLTDAGLGLIKRQILEKSNRTLGKPLLKDVVFSKFSFMEQ